jgi:transcriptional regulator with XRE-family HTH domain
VENDGIVELYRPTGDNVLQLLSAAGEAGELASMLARRFTSPETIQRRNALVNHFMARWGRRGYVQRSAYTEPSPLYNHNGAYRWFITGAGQQYLDNDCVHTEDLIRAAAHAAHAQRSEHINAIWQRALAEAPALLAALPVRCVTRYGEAIRGLRRRYLTLQEIGDMLGITRERVRQIEMGISTSGHQCSACTSAAFNETFMITVRVKDGGEMPTRSQLLDFARSALRDAVKHDTELGWLITGIQLVRDATQPDEALKSA